MARRPKLVQTEFDNELFTELLTGTISTRLYYWRAELCPCRADRTGPDPRCKVCGGDGRLFVSPPLLELEETLLRGRGREELRAPPTAVTSLTLRDGTPLDPAGFSVDPGGRISWAAGTGPEEGAAYLVRYSARQTIRAGVTSVKHRRELTDRGVVDDADAEMSVSRFMEDHTSHNPAWDAAEGDLFELVDVHRREKQHVRRVGDTDRLKYHRVFDVTLTSIRDDQVHTWVEGVDYARQGPDITWVAGRGPNEGEFYAAQYEANPLYTLWRELPQLRHQDALPLPRRYGLKVAETAPKSLLAARQAPGLNFSVAGNAIWFTLL